MRISRFPVSFQRLSSSYRLKLILAAGGLFLASCSLGGCLTPKDSLQSTATLPALPSPVVQYSPLPESTPTITDLFPELEGEVQQSYTFEYLCNPATVTLHLYQSSYEYYQSADKNYYYRGTLPDDWQKEFYINFLSSDNDLEALNGLIEEVGKIVDQNGDDLVIALTSLVQGLTYDCDKLFSYDYQDGEGYQTNFPYETLYTKKGVCGDTTILLGKILGELGYGAAFLVYEESNHMALGIECPVEVATYVEDQRGYCYIETTGPTRIGVKPTTLGGKDFVEIPLIIPIAEGVSFSRMTALKEEMEVDALAYGEVILQMASCQEINLYKEIVDRKAIITAHDGHLASLDIKKDKAETEYLEEYELFNSMGCEGTLPQKQYELCLEQQAIVEEKYALYEDLVNEYNRVVVKRNAEVDRMNQAIDAFNALMDAKDQSCAVVWSERIDTDEETQ